MREKRTHHCTGSGHVLRDMLSPSVLDFGVRLLRAQRHVAVLNNFYSSIPTVHVSGARAEGFGPCTWREFGPPQHVIVPSPILECIQARVVGAFQCTPPSSSGYESCACK